MRLDTGVRIVTMKDRYWVILALVLSFAFFSHLATDIARKQNLRREALAAAGGNLPYQLYITNKYEIFGDIIYTNDYTLSPPSDGEAGLNNLYIRWGVTWGGSQWDFILNPLTLENVKVTVNSGDAIK